MKKIAIALFVAFTLSSCGGKSEKCKGENYTDTCTVTFPVWISLNNDEMFKELNSDDFRGKLPRLIQSELSNRDKNYYITALFYIQTDKVIHEKKHENI